MPKAKRVEIPFRREGPFQFFTCSCGNHQAINEGMPWCSTCGVEYDVGDTAVVLRPDRKTPRFALAKALNLSGGMRIGRERKED